MYQVPLFEPNSDWKMPDEYPDLSAAKGIIFDVESKDPFLNEKGPGYVRGDAHTVGYAIATKDREFCKYYPIRHEEGPNLPINSTLAWLKDTLGTGQEKFTAHGIYDCEAAHADGIVVRGKIRDIQIAEPLLNEESQEGYSLEVLAQKYLGVGKDEELLEHAAFLFREGKRDKDWKKKMKGRLHRFPAKFVGPYAEIDCIRTGEVHDKQLPLLEKEDLLQVYDVECRLIPMLLAMRIKGTPFDVEAAMVKSKEWRLREARLLDNIMKIVGRSVDPWVPTEMKRIYDHYNIPVPMTEKGNPSFENEVMENLGVKEMKRSDGKKRTVLEKAEVSEYPAIQYCVAYRKLNKMRRDFVDGYQKIVVNGRIHAEFHQLRRDEDGTRSGRFSSSNPNLQQVPHRDPEYGPEVRSLFVPEEGLQWGKFDYSQQEPRLTVHYAYLRKMPGAIEAWEIYNTNPNADFHQMTADMAGISRSHAKGINLGLAYGMGKAKLCRQLGMSMEEAEPIFRQYHEKLPFMKLLAQECEQYAQKRGYIRTLLGRRRHFELWEPDVPFDQRTAYYKPYSRQKALELYQGMRLKRAQTRKGMNSLIQGGAADMTKIAMLVWFEQLHEIPYCQVHDEMDIGVRDLDHIYSLRSAMDNCIEIELGKPLTVPMKAEAEVGANWGYMKKVA